MNKVIVIATMIFCASSAFGQVTVEVSKTKKETKNGVEVTTLDGKNLTGFVVESYPNGKPKSWKTLKDGITSGLWQEWYENGSLKFNAHWLDGKGHGLWEYYHENGVLRQEEFYNLDTPVGVFRDFYNNGQIKVKSSWLNGKKYGIWTYYSETGILLKTETYENDKLISTTEKIKTNA